MEGYKVLEKKSIKSTQPLKPMPVPQKKKKKKSGCGCCGKKLSK
jgi:hypothetical protein